MRYGDQGNLFPPDQRFTVSPPPGMCPRHLRIRQQYRDQHYDPRTGNRWPGHAGSPFTIIGRDLHRVSEERRCEWDEKASDQMRLTENICLSGVSPQCDHPAPETPADVPADAPVHVSAWTADAVDITV
jgi:hypothetical protein